MTNLNDYNPENEAPIEGSLRLAVETNGPRTILFRVSGIIELKSNLRIFNPFITIAGQSAPGDGLCLKNYEISIWTHDVIIRYIRCRPGNEMGVDKEGGFETDAISMYEFSENVIIDHCSASWSIDETVSLWSREPNNPPLIVTVQWCIISESLNDSYHPKGPHGYGSLIRFTGGASFHHNLYAHHFSRNPHVDTYLGDMTLDFRNNVIYNYGQPGNTMFHPINMNYVGNYLKPGLDAQTQVGGWPNLESAPPFIDSDNDGLHDDWEIKHGLDPTNNLDNNLDNDGDGYTNIEEWLNGTIPQLSNP